MLLSRPTRNVTKRELVVMGLWDWGERCKTQGHGAITDQIVRLCKQAAQQSDLNMQQTASESGELVGAALR